MLQALSQRFVYACEFLDFRRQKRDETGFIGLPHEVRIDVAELFQIQPPRGLVDPVQVENGRGFIHAEDFLIAMAPTQANQVGIHRFGQVTHVAIGERRQGAMPLGQFRAVGPMNHRHMRKFGYTPAHRRIDWQLAKRVAEMIVASNDMGYAHVMVVDHHGQHIGWCSVGA